LIRVCLVTNSWHLDEVASIALESTQRGRWFGTIVPATLSLSATNPTKIHAILTHLSLLKPGLALKLAHIGPFVQRAPVEFQHPLWFPWQVQVALEDRMNSAGYPPINSMFISIACVIAAKLRSAWCQSARMSCPQCSNQPPLCVHVSRHVALRARIPTSIPACAPFLICIMRHPPLLLSPPLACAGRTPLFPTMASPTVGTPASVPKIEMQ